MFEFLKIHAQRKLEKERFAIQEKASKYREKYKNQFHSVGLVKGATVMLADSESVSLGECTPCWGLLENGWGERRVKEEYTGQSPTGGWSHIWANNKKYSDVLAWKYRAEDGEIQTPLPPNADTEDRFWEAFERAK
jgi:hypothetical protein